MGSFSALVAHFVAWTNARLPLGLPQTDLAVHNRTALDGFFFMDICQDETLLRVQLTNSLVDIVIDKSAIICSGPCCQTYSYTRFCAG